MGWFDDIVGKLTGGNDTPKQQAAPRDVSVERLRLPPAKAQTTKPAERWGYLSSQSQSVPSGRAPVGAARTSQVSRPYGVVQGSERDRNYQELAKQPLANVPAPARAFAKSRWTDQAEEAQKNDNQAAFDAYDQRLAVPGEKQVVEMDWDAYNALTPRQRAAVDANTEMVKAIDADKSDSLAQRDDNYTATVGKLFGEGRDSEVIAPRTVALLDKLFAGQAQDAPLDLDQYLNKDALVNSLDLNLLTEDQIANTSRIKSGLGSARNEDGERTLTADRYEKLNPRAENALVFSRAAQTRLSQTLAGGQTLIQNLQADDLGKRLFGEPSGNVGFGMNERDSTLQFIFDRMARADAPPPDEELAGVLGTIEQNFGVTSDQMIQFFEAKLRSAEYGGTPVSADPEDAGAKYMNPAEFRARYYSKGGQ